MKTRVLLVGFIITALCGCSSTSSKDKTDGVEDSVAMEASGDEGGLSDEPLTEDEGATSAAAEGAPADAGSSGGAGKPLFERIGGKRTIDQFASKFIDALAASPELTKNPQIAAAFKGDQARHKQMFAEFLCANAGGPCTYSGREVKETHAAFKISKAEWNALRKIFIRTLRQMKVPKKERMDLAKIAARQKKNIVQ